MKIFYLHNQNSGERATVAAETREDAVDLVQWSTDTVEGEKDALAILLSRSDSDTSKTSDRKETYL